MDNGSRIVFDMKEEIAQARRERDRLSPALIRAGIARKQAAGGISGPAPLGYMNKRIGNEAWVEIDPTAAPLVKEAFELMATGTHSLRTLLAHLTEKGMRSTRGKILNPGSLRWVLANPFYCGMVRAGEKLVLGKHKALVRLELYWKVQGAMKARSSTHSQA